MHVRFVRLLHNAMDDHVIKPNEYIGTLRWGPDTKFPQLPPFPKSTPPPLDEGWSPYFQVRMQAHASASGDLTLEPPMFDGLSFPMSFIWGFRQVLLSGQWADPVGYKKGRKLYLLIVGASERAEERVLSETNYFAEISHYLPSFEVEVYMTGPEMSTARHRESRKLTEKLTVVCVRGKCKEALEELKAKCQGEQGGGLPPAIVVCAFNTGFASGDPQLRASWTADIKYLAEQGLLTFFTCANDWADLKGEAKIMDILQAKYALPAQQSPFRALSVIQEPDNKERWYCANSCVYAIQGVQKK